MKKLLKNKVKYIVFFVPLLLLTCYTRYIYDFTMVQVNSFTWTSNQDGTNSSFLYSMIESYEYGKRETDHVEQITRIIDDNGPDIRGFIGYEGLISQNASASIFRKKNGAVYLIKSELVDEDSDDKADYINLLLMAINESKKVIFLKANNVEDLLDLNTDSWIEVNSGIYSVANDSLLYLQFKTWAVSPDLKYVIFPVDNQMGVFDIDNNTFHEIPDLVLDTHEKRVYYNKIRAFSWYPDSQKIAIGTENQLWIADISKISKGGNISISKIGTEGIAARIPEVSRDTYDDNGVAKYKIFYINGNSRLCVIDEDGSNLQDFPVPFASPELITWYKNSTNKLIYFFIPDDQFVRIDLESGDHEADFIVQSIIREDGTYFIPDSFYFSPSFNKVVLYNNQDYYIFNKNGTLLKGYGTYTKMNQTEVFE